MRIIMRDHANWSPRHQRPGTPGKASVDRVVPAIRGRRDNLPVRLLKHDVLVGFHWPSVCQSPK